MSVEQELINAYLAKQRDYITDIISKSIMLETRLEMNSKRLADAQKSVEEKDALLMQIQEQLKEASGRNTVFLDEIQRLKDEIDMLTEVKKEIAEETVDADKHKNNIKK